MNRMRHWIIAVVLSVAPGGAALAEDAAVVARLQGGAEAVTAAGTSRPLAQGNGVSPGDTVRTGTGARIELRFSDGMDLTLGERSVVTIAAFEWAPGQSAGKAELALAQGVFLLESGKVGKLPDHPLVVKTPLASVGVRGTRFWGGSLDDPLNVLLLDGRVVVSSPAGTVELAEPGSGTSVTGPGQAPLPPGFWSKERVSRAFATVEFTAPGGSGRNSPPGATVPGY